LEVFRIRRVVLIRRGCLKVPEECLTSRTYFLRVEKDGTVVLRPIKIKEPSNLGIELNEEEIDYFIRRGATI